MSFGSPRQRKAGGSGKLLLFLIVGFALFMLFRNMNRPATTQADRDTGSNSIQQVEKQTQSNRRVPKPKDVDSTTKGDWSIQEVDVKQSGFASPGQKADAKQTQKGDWSIEEVNSGSPNANAPAEKLPPKKTTKGEWTLEEIESKKQP